MFSRVFQTSGASMAPLIDPQPGIDSFRPRATSAVLRWIGRPDDQQVSPWMSDTGREGWV